MQEKTKNIIAVIVGIILILFVMGYIVLAGELKASRDTINEFQSTINSIKDVKERIKDNSEKWNDKDKTIKTLEAEKQSLHDENEALRQLENDAITGFLEGLGLIESSEAQ